MSLKLLFPMMTEAGRNVEELNRPPLSIGEVQRRDKNLVEVISNPRVKMSDSLANSITRFIGDIQRSMVGMGLGDQEETRQMIGFWVGVLRDYDGRDAFF